jgi:molybdopterin-binding protein/molybdate transport repressor ModE-like protein
MKTHSRERIVTPSDVALLAALSQQPNLAQACRQLGMTRDRGMYRLRRMEAAVGAPVVRTHRGGLRSGATELTARGRALLRQGVAPLERVGRLETPGWIVLEGTWRGGPEPSVLLRGGLVLRVSFTAAPGSQVVLAIDPESILVARKAFPTSARNVVRGRISSITEEPPDRQLLSVEGGRDRLEAVVTHEAVRDLGLKVGTSVVLYIKATAIHLLAISPPTLTREPDAAPRPRRTEGGPRRREPYE